MLNEFTWKYFGKYWRLFTLRITWIYRHGFVKEDDMEWIDPVEMSIEEIKEIEDDIL